MLHGSKESPSSARVMGGGIAAQMADAGVEVILLDIVPEGAANRNALAEAAVKKQRESVPPGFVFPEPVRLITCGNLEDDLGKLKDCDWIIEAVKEDVRIKQDVYRKIDANRKSGSIVSSNTSTLPLGTLTSGMPEGFARDFMITHFFNPPRFTQLLEVVQSDNMRPAKPTTLAASLTCRSARPWCMQGYTGLHRQPHRRLLDDAWARGSCAAGRSGRAGRRGDGRGGGHSQDRHLRAVRHGRHRPDVAYRVHDDSVGGCLPTTCSASSTGKKRWRCLTA